MYTPKIVKYAELVINSTSEIFGYICNIVILIINFIIFYEVVARYIAGSPTIWATETCQFLLPVLCFLGASYCLKYGGHIRVDLSVILFPSRVRQMLDIMVSTAGLVFFLVLGWQAFLMWQEAYVLNFTSGGIFDVPLKIPYIFFPIGMLILCLQLIVDIFKNTANFLGNHEKKELST